MANVPFTRQHAAVYAESMIAAFLGASIDTAGRVTDFNAGSVARTLLEAIALRFEALDAATYLALQRALPTILFEVFGEGDGVTSSVGFPALPALPASGVVRFVRAAGGTGDVVIPVGTRLTVPGTGGVPPKVFLVTVEAIIPDGAPLAETLATAQRIGSIGNTPAHTMVLTDAIPGVASATNPSAILNGAEAETDAARRVRFTAYLRNLARAQFAGLEVGASRAQVLSAGTVIEQVRFARAVLVPEKRGLVDLFLDNGGGTASPALIATAQNLIDGVRLPSGARRPGYKAAGVVVVCKAVRPQMTPVAARLRIDPGFVFGDVAAAVRAAIDAYLFGLGVFEDLVLADLIATIATVRGVADVVLLTPTANIVAAQGMRLLPGTTTLLQEAA